MKVAVNTSRLLRNIPLPDEAGEVHANAAVVDIGTGTTRIGFSGDDAPRLIEPTVYSLEGQPPLEGGRRIASGKSGRGGPTIPQPEEAGLAKRRVTLLGKAHAQRERVPVSPILERGLVSDWDSMDALLGYLSTDLLQLQRDGGTPLLLAEKALIPRSQREKIAQLLFEHHNIPSLYFSPSPVLALYAHGLSSGLSIELGFGTCHAVPVYEGFSLFHTIQQASFGGDDLTRYIQSTLHSAGESSSGALLSPHSARGGVHGNTNISHPGKSITMMPAGLNPAFIYDISAYMKEMYGMVKPCRDVFLHRSGSNLARLSTRGVLGSLPPPQASNAEAVHHTLPDGTVVHLGLERFAVGEALFDPLALQLIAAKDSACRENINALVATEFASATAATAVGIHKMAHTAVTKCDSDLMPQLLSNIVLSGGTSLLRGLPQRLQVELEALFTPGQSRSMSVSQGGRDGDAPRNDPAGIRVSISDPISRLNLGYSAGRVQIEASPERQNAAFVGGSILASLPTFQDVWVTRADYDEQGCAAVVRNCL